MSGKKYLSRLLALMAGSSLLAPVVAAGVEADPVSSYFATHDVLVEAPSRRPMPLSRVAENVTVVTAEEIELMGAHTLDEVLALVPGVFMDIMPRDFAGIQSAVYLHGSNYEHVLVLFDGMRMNHMSNSINFLVNIPVQAVERIEVIKGAASSTWGSALGGVINIVTKQAEGKPLGGMVSGSYGEWDSRDLRAELSGSEGSFGFYLTAADQNSDGIGGNRYFDNRAVYGKGTVTGPGGLRFTVTALDSEPDGKYLEHRDFDFQLMQQTPTRLFTATLEVPLAEHLTWTVYGGYKTYAIDSQGSLYSDPGFVWHDQSYGERATFLSTRVNWDLASHSLTAGLDYESNQERDEDYLAPASERFDDENWALFVNDTFDFGRFSLTPGVRYDHLGESDDLVSPSLGLVYRLGNSSLVRAGVSRGFRKPLVGTLKGDWPFFGPNPDLEPETIWTYQAGFEAGVASWGRLKTTFFLHDAEKSWEFAGGIPSNAGGDLRRRGGEAEIESVPFHHLTLAASATYVHFEPENADSDQAWTSKIILRYDDQAAWRAQLAGQFISWGEREMVPSGVLPADGNFLWDLAVNRRFSLSGGSQVEFFGIARNLFDTDQYLDDWKPNAGRWVEAGVRLRF